LGLRRLHPPAPRTGAPLEPPSPPRAREDVPRDAEEPRPGRPACLVTEAPAGEPGLREGLRRQVVRGVGIPAPGQVEAVDALCVAVVERSERGRVRVRTTKKLRIAQHESRDSVVIATSSMGTSGDGARFPGCYGAMLDGPRHVRDTIGVWSIRAISS